MLFRCLGLLALLTASSLGQVIDWNNGVSLECQDSAMKVSIDNSLIAPREGFTPPDFVFQNSDDTKCLGVKTGTHLVFTAPFGTCGTTLQTSEGNLVYKNVLSQQGVTVKTSGSTLSINTLPSISLAMTCTYNSLGLVSSSFTPQDQPLSTGQMSDVSVNVNFHQHKDSKTVMSKTDFPMVVDDSNPVIHVSIIINHQSKSLKLVGRALNCWLTNRLNFGSTQGSDTQVLKNMCPTSDAFEQSSAASLTTDQRFGVKVKFSPKKEDIYLACQTLICDLSNPDYRPGSPCLMSCPKRVRRSAPTGPEIPTSGHPSVREILKAQTVAGIRSNKKPLPPNEPPGKDNVEKKLALILLGSFSAFLLLSLLIFLLVRWLYHGKAPCIQRPTPELRQPAPLPAAVGFPSSQFMMFPRHYDADT